MSIREFVSNRSFDCSLAFDSGAGQCLSGKAKYQFNWAESIGNNLLEPLEKAFSFYDTANGPWVEAAAIVALITAAILGSLGILFKKCGEWANPNNEQRQKALSKIGHLKKVTTAYLGYPVLHAASIYTILIEISQTYATCKSQLTALLVQNILKQQPVQELSPALGLHTVYLPVGRRQEAIKTQQQWNTALEEFEDLLRNDEDTAGQEEEILALAGNNLRQNAQEFIDLAKRNKKLAAQIALTIQEYENLF